ncbi:hypothetical protein [Novipirellula rosea]|uniref:Uncharacterized protein n=1 Tax=Novipirellula rosea TaxID=1031540 RepID=A0ABP8MK35_9BACT|tara:strand:- start:3152 stop:3334 length:183 start_codon:yes stop_codon:yes gene_type:complete
MLSKIEDDAPGLQLAFRKQWRELDERLQQKRLSDVIAQVVLNHRDDEIAVETTDEFKHAL